VWDWRYQYLHGQISPSTDNNSPTFHSRFSVTLHTYIIDTTRSKETTDNNAPTLLLLLLLLLLPPLY